MVTLGVSAFYHDSAAALVLDGNIVAAAQEERFSRIKNDRSFPLQAIEYCLDAAKLKLSDIDSIAFYDNPLLRGDRISAMARHFGARGFSFWEQATSELLSQYRTLRWDWERSVSTHSSPVNLQSRLVFLDHHLSHAASSFLVSPFERAAIVTLDGVGEWTTTAIFVGRGSYINIVEQISFPDSLGLLYSAFTSYLGFRVNSGEYKVMGLAPYGRPIYADLIERELINIHGDGSFSINTRYLNFESSDRLFNKAFEELLGGPARQPTEKVSQRHMDLSASIQMVLERAVVLIAKHARLITGESNLCLAGGVALNCVANRAIRKESGFERVWVQPAAGDAGGSLGAALWAYYVKNGNRTVEQQDGMRGTFLGPEYSQLELEQRLRAEGAVFEVAASEDRMIEECCTLLLQGHAVGWFQGRMEFGPRALGARSILTDPRSAEMPAKLNEKIKYRENFRPFAPSVAVEVCSQWFDMSEPSPYMLFVADVLPADGSYSCSLPAVTHVDGTARVQTVDSKRNRLFHRLLTRFGDLTGCPVLLNTSFNVRGEPIVCTPEDAFRCFMGSGLESLVIGCCIVKKERQITAPRFSYKDAFQPD